MHHLKQKNKERKNPDLPVIIGMHNNYTHKRRAPRRRIIQPDMKWQYEQQMRKAEGDEKR